MGDKRERRSTVQAVDTERRKERDREVERDGERERWEGEMSRDRQD